MEKLVKKMSGSNARFALIDADSVLYAVALKAEACVKATGLGEDEYFIVKDGEECYRDVVQRLEALVQEIGAEDALICLTPAGKSYRYLLHDAYKANRATFRRPEMLRPLQALVAARKPFRTLSVRGLEADDLCGISSTSLQKAGLREPVIVSIDKDMLQIPGLSYSWMAAARRQEIGVLTETTEFEGDRMHLYQTLVGDAVDNYTGCPGIGPKKADKLLNEMMTSVGVLDWRWIVRQFEAKGFNAEYALTQARLARILRDTDWDAALKEVRLWQPKDFATAAVSPTKPTSTEPEVAPTTTASYSRILLDELKGATLH